VALWNVHRHAAICEPVLELLVVERIDFTGNQEMACTVFFRPWNYNTKNIVATEGK